LNFYFQFHCPPDNKIKTFGVPKFFCSSVFTVPGLFLCIGTCRGKKKKLENVRIPLPRKMALYSDCNPVLDVDGRMSYLNQCIPFLIGGADRYRVQVAHTRAAINGVFLASKKINVHLRFYPLSQF
jgi:hypothetical protein